MKYDDEDDDGFVRRTKLLGARRVSGLKSCTVLCNSACGAFFSFLARGMSVVFGRWSTVLPLDGEDMMKSQVDESC